MGNKVLAEVRKAIEDKIAVMKENIRGLQECDLNIEDQDEVSRADAMTTRGLNGSLVAKFQRELAGLETALLRITNGDPDFGYCARCGEEIPLARILAVPASAVCVDCAH